VSHLPKCIEQLGIEKRIKSYEHDTPSCLHAIDREPVRRSAVRAGSGRSTNNLKASWWIPAVSARQSLQTQPLDDSCN